MSTFTEHYNFIKPGEGDFYDIQDWNENMDAIDAQMALNEEAIAPIGEKIDGMDSKIGTSADTEENSLFGKLHQLSVGFGEIQLVKSIQHVTYSVPRNTSSGTRSISRVTPERCIVLLERLYDHSGCSTVNYTLNATSISLTHVSADYPPIFGFWVIELY